MTASSVSVGGRLFGAGINAGYQYIGNAPDHGWGWDNLANLNWTGVGLSAVNPTSLFINSVGSNFGRITFQNGVSEVIGGNNFTFKKAAISTVVEYTGGKIGEKLGILSKFGGFSKNQSSKLGDILGGIVTTPAAIIVEEKSKHEK